MSLRVLPIEAASDGTFATPAVPSMTQNDAYFLDKIAERWSKDLLLPQSGIVYRLNALPTGYAGYEKGRPGSAHIDRYLYGHPRGVFRSVNELYPHFKQLQEVGGTVGCPCKLCVSGPRKSKPTATDGRSQSSSSASASRGSNLLRNANPAAAIDHMIYTGNPPSDPPTPPRRQQIDDEGCQDIHRTILDQVRDAGSVGCRGVVADTMSPDWHVGHDILMRTIEDCGKLPSFSPRIGEVVLFVRSNSTKDWLAWEPVSQSIQHISIDSSLWLGPPKWEVGVVTQLPIKPPLAEDLQDCASDKEYNIINSGYRIEPLSPFGKANKAFTKQRKYLPLHLIRPFWTWRDCLNRHDESDWHPTIKAALTITNSFCILARHKFSGQWPEATIFANAVYLGAELITVGDTVRLLPRPDPTRTTPAPVTDVLRITSLRLRFVNLDESTDDDYDESRPYNTCLHVSGIPYTLDPARSFNQSPLPNPPTDHLPPGLAGFGVWYPMLDPSKPALRLEIPYTRILSRCADHEAVKAWFAAPTTPPPSSATGLTNEAPPPTSSFLAVNQRPAPPTLVDATYRPSETLGALGQGLAGLRAARVYSVANDKRIDRAAGKSWFWAESRVEQLDLYEVNGRAVGTGDAERSRDEVRAWRKAVKVVVEGKKRAGVEEQRKDEGDKMDVGETTGEDPKEEDDHVNDVNEEQDDDEDESSDGSEDNVPAGMLGRAPQRSDPVLISDDEDDVFEDARD